MRSNHVRRKGTHVRLHLLKATTIAAAGWARSATTGHQNATHAAQAAD